MAGVTRGQEPRLLPPPTPQLLPGSGSALLRQEGTPGLQIPGLRAGAVETPLGQR